MAVAERRVRPAGSYLFVQGEPARLLFVIKAGRIKLTKTDATGSEILVDIRKAGDFLGETFLSEDADYPSLPSVSRTVCCAALPGRASNIW